PPPEVVRAHLDGYPRDRRPAVAALYADPEAGLRRLVAEIDAYWRIALAADWPRIPPAGPAAGQHPDSTGRGAAHRLGLTDGYGRLGSAETHRQRGSSRIR
ncbi:hypothetical protein JNW88_27715, partial [Micromonospora sp. ATA32]|nr:hypothetical protein [Micromonospora sp. ATA32]